MYNRIHNVDSIHFINNPSNLIALGRRQLDWIWYRYMKKMDCKISGHFWISLPRINMFRKKMILHSFVSLCISCGFLVLQCNADLKVLTDFSAVPSRITEGVLKLLNQHAAEDDHVVSYCQSHGHYFNRKIKYTICTTVGKNNQTNPYVFLVEMERFCDNAVKTYSAYSYSF